jgi:hypothetical protein
MKKLNSLYLYAAMLIVMGTSCKKDLSDRFYNPDQLSSNVTDIVPGNFTSTIANNKLFIQDYGEWYYLMNAGTSITGYSQIAQRYISYRYDWFSSYNDLTSGNGFDDYPITGQSYFEASYGRIKSWETVRNEVNNRSGQSKMDADMYLKLLTVVKEYQSAKLVDFFNSIPYFNAFSGSNNSATYWYAAYDDPKLIYEDIVTQLGNMADSLPIAYNLMSATGKQILAAQDIAFKGDITKWVKFTNATRLKLLVRLAGVDAAFAKPLIQATLAKTLPTEDIQFNMWYNTDLQSGGGFWMRGLYENTYASFIPNIIMKRMNYGDSLYNPGLDDPRLPVIAMPTKYKSYKGVSLNIDAQSQIYDSGEKYYAYADNLTSSLSTNTRSMYNHATFHRNGNMPVYMFSLAELDLLKAEIVLKGYASTGKNAEDHMKDAVIHSTNYWYNLNAVSDYKTKITAAGVTALYPTKPTDAAIASWGDTIKSKFVAAATIDDKMEILMQQKFIHLNLMQPYELWTELRRTGHPKLEPFTWHGAVWTPFPERVHYPSSEQTNNPTNYSKVSAANNTTTKIFWVPADRNTSLYWSDYNYK